MATHKQASHFRNYEIMRPSSRVQCLFSSQPSSFIISWLCRQSHQAVIIFWDMFSDIWRETITTIIYVNISTGNVTRGGHRRARSLLCPCVHDIWSFGCVFQSGRTKLICSWCNQTVHWHTACQGLGQAALDTYACASRRSILGRAKWGCITFYLGPCTWVFTNERKPNMAQLK